MVVDNATGLMWHQSGSDERVGLVNAKQWIEKLNNKGYAGHNDWRLPTVEEAASLLESNIKNDGLKIDTVFSHKQEWIWTGDECEIGTYEYLRGIGRLSVWNQRFCLNCCRLKEKRLTKHLKSGISNRN